ncbi:MAG: diguanylate cyclase [Gammaproteobacteria bacterium]|nr:diguanylate cyclase [Gammaproteobacteria bacterium]
MNAHQEQKTFASTYHLQQHVLVRFLYDRYVVGMAVTLIVSLVATSLAAFEMEIQARAHWVYAWFGVMLLIQYARYLLKQSYDRIKDEDYLSHHIWKWRFTLGVLTAAAWQGLGALLILPYISSNLQLIIHAFLLGMGAGAIAYLATFMMIYASYLMLMILPVTIYLFWLATPDSLVLGFMHIFMIITYYIGVGRMNQLITDSLHLRFDNEMLVNDLQGLLEAVAISNKELDRISTTDELTGAANFRAFRVQLEKERIRHINNRLPMSLVMLNVDFYYEYNVHYGQEQGNESLVEIAALLMDQLTKRDEMVARINGAEFAILLPDISCEGARIMMEKAMLALHDKQIKNEKSKVDPLLTLSIGICCIPVTERINSQDLLSRADRALRMAKNNGRNRIEIVST